MFLDYHMNYLTHTSVRNIGICRLLEYCSILLMLSIVGCTPSYQGIEAKFKQIERLASVLTPIAEDDIANPSLMATSNGLLFVANLHTDRIFSVFDIQTGHKLSEFGTTGRGPEELLSVSTLSVNQNRLFVFDAMTHKFATITSSGHWNDPIHMTYNIINVNLGEGSKTRPFRLYALSDSLYVGTGVGYDNSQFHLYNHTGNFLHSFEPYSLEKPKQKHGAAELALAYQGSMAVNPNSSRYVWASLNGVMLKFFGKDDNGDIVKKNEYIYEYPQYRHVRRGGGESAALLPSARIGFIFAQSSDKHFYLLYKGVRIDSENIRRYFISNTILVYSQDGTPVRKFVLDRDISMFAVSEDDSLLIGYTSDEETGAPQFIAYDISPYRIN